MLAIRQYFNERVRTHFVSVVSARVIQFAAVVSVVSSPFLVSECKVITFIPIYQNNLVKKS